MIVYHYSILYGYLQIGSHLATSFQPRTASTIVRTAIRKSVTRKPNRATKKLEPGGCLLLMTEHCTNKKIIFNVVDPFWYAELYGMTFWSYWSSFGHVPFLACQPVHDWIPCHALLYTELWLMPKQANDLSSEVAKGRIVCSRYIL